MANKSIRFWDGLTNTGVDILAVDNGDGTYALKTSGSGNDPTTVAVFQEDFLFGNSCATTISGTGAGVGTGNSSIINGDTHPGQCDLNTGTATTGRAAINPGAAGPSFAFGAGAVIFEADVLLPNLSDGTDTYEVWIGFNDLATGDGTDEIAFRYSNGLNGGKWQCVTRSNSVESTQDSGIAVVANTWYKLRIEVNAAGTSAAFFVNGTVITPITTNIPTGAARATQPIVTIIKSLGVNNRILFVDYVYVRNTLTTAR